MLSPGVVLQQRYRIKHLLAHGGMGAVYEAEAVHLRNVIVAVKQTFFSEDRKYMREQFEREAATLARLRHPALPQVKDHFVEGGGQFLVMDYIAGDDLGVMLGKRMKEIGEPFEFRQVMEWGERLLDALVYIHAQYPPVIHRDIKPQNLKLTPQGELFLIDFGLSKDATTPTRKGHSVHAYTLEFAPPEQIKGEKTDARSDLYSLGATLYHLATGKFPPDARIREESVVNHLLPDLLQPAHRVNPEIPFAFAVTLAKSMALDREQRYKSAKEMQEALRQIKPAIEAEIAERERQQQEERKKLQEESRRRNTGGRRKSKDAGPASLKQAVEAEIAERERRKQEERKRLEEESRKRNTGRQRKSKDAAPAPLKHAVEAEVAEKERQKQGKRKSLKEESRKRNTGRQRKSKDAAPAPLKQAVKAEIAEKARQKQDERKSPKEESRKRNTGRQGKSKDAALLPLKQAVGAGIAEKDLREGEKGKSQGEEPRQRNFLWWRKSKEAAPAPLNQAVEAEIAEKERQKQDEHKSPKEESRKRNTGQQGKSKDAAPPPLKQAVGAGIAERELQKQVERKSLEKEPRKVKTPWWRKSKDSAPPPLKHAFETVVGERKPQGEEDRKGRDEAPRKVKIRWWRKIKDAAPPPSKHAVETVIGERERQEEEEHKSLDEESSQRKTDWWRESNDAPPLPLEHAVETVIGEGGRQVGEDRKSLEEEAGERKTRWWRKNKHAAPPPSMQEESDSKDEDPASLKRVAPHEAPAGLASRETVANERRIGQGTSPLEPASAAPPVIRNKQRVVIGAITRDIFISLLLYLLWNFIFLAYLFWNIWIPANLTKDKTASATLLTNVGAEPTPLPSPAASYMVLPARIEMVYVPGGSFLMGSPESEPERRSAEGPQRLVTLPSFYIGKYEVTQAQWRVVMGANPSKSRRDDLPVETVSWDDAKEFCRKLSQMTGQEYRLPTEAEWEYACRARTTGAFAGDLDAMAWYVKNSGARTHPVGQKQPNGFGIYDMHGNVWEWCEDNWHNSYNGAPTDGSAWLDMSATGSARVFRGGGWRFDSVLCRSADRSYGVPDFRNGYIGFRIVRVGG